LLQPAHVSSTGATGAAAGGGHEAQYGLPPLFK